MQHTLKTWTNASMISSFSMVIAIGASGWLCQPTQWPDLADLAGKKIVNILKHVSQLLCSLMICKFSQILLSVV